MNMETLEEADRRIDRMMAEHTAYLKRSIRIDRHAKYMRSEEWQAIRDLKFSITGRQCEKCGALHQLDVHHLNYDRFGGDELMTDLQVLCRSCHEAVHGRKFEERSIYDDE